MKRLIFPAIGGLLLATAAAPQLAMSQEERNTGHQNTAATAPDKDSTRDANDNQNRRDEQNRGDQNRADSADDDEIEYRGMEHAALGVLLSERSGANGGVRIRETLPNSPANRAGLHAGDRIIQIDGKQMNTYGDVIRFINRVQPGQQANFTVRRDNQEKAINVTFATHEEVWGNDQQRSAQNHERDGHDGNRGRNNDDRMTRQGDNSQRRWSYQNQQTDYGHQATLGVGLESERGIPIVRRVVPNGPADQAGLQPGDEIVAVNNQQVRNHSDLLNVLSRSQPGDQVDVVVQQDGRNHTMRVRLAANETNPQQARHSGQNYEREGYHTDGTRLEGVQPDGFRRDGYRADRKVQEER